MTAAAAPAPESPPRAPLATGLVLLVGGVNLGLHLATALVTPFGVHRDTFLYFAMGDHLSLWRMDFPPLIAILARVTAALGGRSVLGVGIMPAVASTALIVLAALIAWHLGGGKYAQAVAMLGVLCNGLFLRAGELFQPVVLDQLWWTMALLGVVLLCRNGHPRWWLLIGVACGLGILTKFSMLILGAALLAGTLLTTARRTLLTRWPWAAAGIALIIGSPAFVGQLRLGWPLIGQMQDLREAQLAHVGILSFFGKQLLYGPATLLAAAGLVSLLLARRYARFRMLGWTCLVALLLVLLAHGKPYYIGPIHPALIAAGALLLETLPHWWGRAGRFAVPALLVGYFAATLPLTLPVLPPAATARYAARAGITATVTTNTGTVGVLPQDFADMLYWEDKVAVLSRVYHQLPEATRDSVVILAGNYGQAGAIDFYRRRYGLPQAVNVTGSYWFFGPGERPGDVLLTLGVGPERLRQGYGAVTVVDVLHYPMAVEEEQTVTIAVARRPAQTLQQVWPSLAGMH